MLQCCVIFFLLYSVQRCFHQVLPVNAPVFTFLLVRPLGQDSPWSVLFRSDRSGVEQLSLPLTGRVSHFDFSGLDYIGHFVLVGRTLEFSYLGIM